MTHHKLGEGRSSLFEVFDDFSLNTHTFEPGGELKVHRHGIEDNHLSFVDVGELLVLGDQEGRILRPGDAVKWKAGEWHGFRARTPAKLRNIRHFRSGVVRAGLAGEGHPVWYVGEDGAKLMGQVVHRETFAHVDVDVLIDGKLVRKFDVPLFTTGNYNSVPRCVEVGGREQFDIRIIEAARQQVD